MSGITQSTAVQTYPAYSRRDDAPAPSGDRSTRATDAVPAPAALERRAVTPVSSSGPRDGDRQELTPQQQAEIADLEARDRDVHARERALLGAAGPAATGGAAFTYETGPDGKLYAIGGDVSIDVSAVADDPATTIRKMEHVRRAALAPPDPSPHDRRVAAEAAEIEARAWVAEESTPLPPPAGAHTHDGASTCMACAAASYAAGALSAAAEETPALSISA